MPRPRLPHLRRETTRHGKPVWYLRPAQGGPRVRLRAEFGTPEFQAEYLAALGGAAPARPSAHVAAGTLEWLWKRYIETTAWTNDLGPATRRQRENIMRGVLRNAGPAPLAVFGRTSVVAGLERRRATPSQANNYLAALRGLFGWALKAGHVKADPTADVDGLKRPKTGGFPHWTPEDEAAFVARWPKGTPQHLAYMVHACTGLRRGDAVRLGRQHFGRDGRIRIRAEKNGYELTIPVHPDLAEALRACPPAGLAILNSRRVEPWGSKESYGNTFHSWAKAAGVRKNSHGIRKLAATRVAEAGASEHEMMALFGWTDPAMARVYTQAANRVRLANAAAAKLGISGDVLALPWND